MNGDPLYLLLTIAVFVLILAAMGAVADELGEPERWESKRRNQK